MRSPASLQWRDPRDPQQWRPLSESEFTELVSEMNRASGAGWGEGVRVMSELLDEMLTANQPWADAAFVALLQGSHGDASRDLAVQAVADGFKVSGAVLSFVRTCVALYKLPLLAAVADCPVPDPIKRQRRQPDSRFPGATTDGGYWLDTLANIAGVSAASFARQVEAFSSNGTGRFLAELLVKHDPQHGAIAELEGFAGYPLVLEALMRRRIAETQPSVAVESRSPEVTAGRPLRRAQRVL